MIAFGLAEALSVLWGPGLVFLVAIIWLIRRVIRAARTESQLEEERLRQWMKGEVEQLQSSKAEPRLMRVPSAADRKIDLARRGSNVAPAVSGTESLVAFPEARVADAPASASVGLDRTGVTEAELALVRPLFGNDVTAAAPPRVLWVRSTGSHIVFCERLDASAAPRDVITVVKVADGAVVGKWQFG